MTPEELKGRAQSKVWPKNRVTEFPFIYSCRGKTFETFSKFAFRPQHCSVRGVGMRRTRLMMTMIINHWLHKTMRPDRPASSRAQKKHKPQNKCENNLIITIFWFRGDVRSVSVFNISYVRPVNICNSLSFPLKKQWSPACGSAAVPKPQLPAFPAVYQGPAGCCSFPIVGEPQVGD